MQFIPFTLKPLTKYSSAVKKTALGLRRTIILSFLAFLAATGCDDDGNAESEYVNES